MIKKITRFKKSERWNVLGKRNFASMLGKKSALFEYINRSRSHFLEFNGWETNVELMDDVDQKLFYYDNAKWLVEKKRRKKESSEKEGREIHLDGDHVKDSALLHASRCFDEWYNVGDSLMGPVLSEEVDGIWSISEIERSAELVWKMECNELFTKNVCLLHGWLKGLGIEKLVVKPCLTSVSVGSALGLSRILYLFMFSNSFKTKKEEEKEVEEEGLILEELCIYSNRVMGTFLKKNENGLWADMGQKSACLFLIKKYLSVLTLIKNLTLEIITKKERNNLSICLKNLKYNIFIGTVGLFKLRGKKEVVKKREGGNRLQKTKKGRTFITRLGNKRKEEKAASKKMVDGEMDDAFAFKKKIMMTKPTALIQLLKANLYSYDSFLNLYKYIDLKMHNYGGAFDPVNAKILLEHSDGLLSRSELNTGGKSWKKEGESVVINYVVDNAKQLNYPWSYNYDGTIGEKKGKKAFNLHLLSKNKRKNYELLRIHKITKERYGGTKVGK